MQLVRQLFDRPYLLLVLTTLFWSGNYIIGRAIRFDIPPVTLATLRWSLACVVIFPLCHQIPLSR